MELLHFKKIRPFELLDTDNQIFAVRFNPHLKKAQNKYELLMESVVSVTHGTDLKLYISFSDVKYDNTTLYDEFLKMISTIHRIDIVYADRSNNIINTQHFEGKFTNAMHTNTSYEPNLKFLAIFEPKLK